MLALVIAVAAFIAGVEATSSVSRGFTARIIAGTIVTSSSAQTHPAKSPLSSGEVVLQLAVTSLDSFGGLLEQTTYAGAWSNRDAVDPADVNWIAAQAGAVYGPLAAEAVRHGRALSLEPRWRRIVALAARLAVAPLAILLGFALFGGAADREARSLRAMGVCPKCLYDAGAAAPRRCPECGGPLALPKARAGAR